MDIINKKITELKIYEKNPKKHSEKQINCLKKSIQEFGFVIPILISSDNVIIAGHGRYEAAKRLKLKDVPCLINEKLSLSQQNAYRIADNKIAELGDWDYEMLLAELEKITQDFDVEILGCEKLDEDLNFLFANETSDVLKDLEKEQIKKEKEKEVEVFFVFQFDDIKIKLDEPKYQKIRDFFLKNSQGKSLKEKIFNWIVSL